MYLCGECGYRSIKSNATSRTKVVITRAPKTVERRSSRKADANLHCLHDECAMRQSLYSSGSSVTAICICIPSF